LFITITLPSSSKVQQAIIFSRFRKKIGGHIGALIT